MQGETKNKQSNIFATPSPPRNYLLLVQQVWKTILFISLQMQGWGPLHFIFHWGWVLRSHLSVKERIVGDINSLGEGDAARRPRPACWRRLAVTSGSCLSPVSPFPFLLVRWGRPFFSLWCRISGGDMATNLALATSSKLELALIDAEEGMRKVFWDLGVYGSS